LASLAWILTDQPVKDTLSLNEQLALVRTSFDDRRVHPGHLHISRVSLLASSGEGVLDDPQVNLEARAIRGFRRVTNGLAPK
jgi:hypothetical protein